MDAKRNEISAICNNTEIANFENTMVALDKSGRQLSIVEQLFDNLTMSHSNPQLQAVEMTMAPKLAAFKSELFLNEKLFERVDAVMRLASSHLSEEQRELVSRFHLDFVRAGARFEPKPKARYSTIMQRLAQLSAQFSQNVLAAESAYWLELKTEQDRAGLPGYLLAAAQNAAKERAIKGADGISDGFVITLSRSLVVPFLSFSTNRVLREQAFKAWTDRGSKTNYEVIREILVLRQEQATMHGYASFADYALADRMAGTPQAALDLTRRAWEPAKIKAAQEKLLLEAVAKTEGMQEPLQAWDWRFYAEKVRAKNYSISDEETKPFFSLKNMTLAMFDCAKQLFGIHFIELSKASTYHPDVKIYEVLDSKNQRIAYFLADNFARSNKRGGAWMSTYRTQSRSNATSIPIISNNNNFARAEDPDRTLLSVDDVNTLFHEFGHGLHGMLSNVTYDRLSGTNVLGDFVELPSQLFEHWGMSEQVLTKHARHVDTGEPISAELIKKIIAVSQFNKGFETVEYCACILVDFALHTRTEFDQLEFEAFEQEQLKHVGMPKEIVMRHRLPHFGHLFQGDYYAAGYYVYLWAEVLDADAFDAFVEAGNIFDQPTADKLRTHIYAAGSSVAPMKTYRAFRGRDPKVEPMLRDRGLL